uniref:Uncharacterized protein n=1 Tax=Steinernema glaseri TaxID=37863 RepID=A0A1I7ZP13_9BILA
MPFAPYETDVRLFCYLRVFFHPTRRLSAIGPMMFLMKLASLCAEVKNFPSSSGFPDRNEEVAHHGLPICSEGALTDAPRIKGLSVLMHHRCTGRAPPPRGRTPPPRSRTPQPRGRTPSPRGRTPPPRSRTPNPGAYTTG